MARASKVKVFNYGAHSARDYWVLITKPDIEEFKCMRSPKTVAHVVQSLWGQLEWYAQESGNTSQTYFALCPELACIRDIAFSAKHRALERPRQAVASMGLRPTGHLGYGVTGGYNAPTGGYGSLEPVAILDDGTTHRLLDLVEKIEAFWQKIFP